MGELAANNGKQPLSGVPQDKKPVDFQAEARHLTRAWPLGRQLGVVLGIAILLLGFGVSGFIRSLTTQSLLNVVTKNAENTVSLLAAFSTHAVVEQNTLALATIAEQTLQQDATILSIEILDADGQPLVNRKRLTDRGTIRHRQTVDCEIQGADRPLGIVVVEFNLAEPYTIIKRSVERMYWFLMGLLLVLSGILGWRGISLSCVR